MRGAGQARAPLLHEHTTRITWRRAATDLAECVGGKRDVESVIKTMEDAGLRAGRAVPRRPEVAHRSRGARPEIDGGHIDEGEPGTFKDRIISSAIPIDSGGHAHRRVAVDIQDIFIYLRDEYHACRVMLEREVAALIANPRDRFRASTCAAARRLHLRRRVGDDRSIEGRRGTAAPAPRTWRKWASSAVHARHMETLLGCAT